LYRLIELLDPNNIRRHSRKPFPRIEVKFEDTFGAKYILDLGQHVDYRLFMNGSFNQVVPEIIRRFGGNKEVALVDVGANVGLVTISCAIQGYSVLAIEPIKSHIEKLRRNLVINSGLDVIVEEFAVTSSQFNDAEITLYSPPGNSGATSLDANWNPSVANSFKSSVKTTTIDILIEKHKEVIGSKKILLKIDVEGMEIEVLEGAINTLAKYEFLIIMEWKNPKVNAKRNLALEEFLNRNNLEIFTIFLDKSSGKLSQAAFTFSKNYEDVFICKKSITPSLYFD
jgi:FkbM family methyltransferase